MSALLHLILIVSMMLVLTTALPAELCFRRLDKFCRIQMPEECPVVSKAESFKALTDCCAGQCTPAELAEACCAILS